MTISKRSRAQRAKHYKSLSAQFVLAGGHPDWIPPNTYGNLSLLRIRLENLERYGGAGFMTRPNNRAARREEYRKWTAMFALAGGHEDWYVPFNHQWKRIYADRIKSLEAGDTFYSQPRKQHDYSPTSRITSSTPALQTVKRV